MTRRNFVRMLGSAGVCALTGCSLFVSLDGLNDAGADDAAITSDASADVGISDSPSNGDSPTNVDSGDAGVCNGFCDDFDNRTTVADGWDGIGTFGGGSDSDLSISSDQYLSPPHSLHAQIAARASAGNAVGALLGKDLPLTGGKMIVDFDMMIVGSQSGYTGFVNLMELSVGGNYAGSITSSGGGDHTVVDYWVDFSDGGHIQPTYDLGVTRSGWHHYQYAADYDPSNGSITVAVDGVMVVNVSASDTYGLDAAPGVFNLALGYTSEPTSPAYDVYFDNVQVQ